MTPAFIAVVSCRFNLGGAYSLLNDDRSNHHRDRVITIAAGIGKPGAMPGNEKYWLNRHIGVKCLLVSDANASAISFDFNVSFHASGSFILLNSVFATVCPRCHVLL
ncbi:MAG: hypothetical protein DYG95_12095 [Chlorobi bacterium CHB1]|nr:hypothetical protein [Chlorobi bacterium CHB1]